MSFVWQSGLEIYTQKIYNVFEDSFDQCGPKGTKAAQDEEDDFRRHPAQLLIARKQAEKSTWL